MKQIFQRHFGKVYSIGEYEWPIQIDWKKWSYSDLEANSLYPHIITVRVPKKK